MNSDFVDTDRLPIYNSGIPEQGKDALAETARFDEGFGSEPVEDWVPYKQLHPYAEGVIRFYRARTIVLCEEDPKAGERAWNYLEPLMPHNLPPHVRALFFELAYFVNSCPGTDDSRFAGFRRRVIDIAVRIDEFMDELDQVFVPRNVCD